MKKNWTNFAKIMRIINEILLKKNKFFKKILNFEKKLVEN